jgi:hypothetical protein
MRSVGGSFPLGRIFGVAVLVHWSWLLVAIFEVKRARARPKDGFVRPKRPFLKKRSNLELLVEPTLCRRA